MFYTQSAKIVPQKQQIGREQNKKQLNSASTEEIWQSGSQKKQNLYFYTTKQLRSSDSIIPKENFSLSSNEKRQSISLLQISNQATQEQKMTNIKSSANDRSFKQVKPNLDETLSFKEQNFRKKEGEENNEGPLFDRIKNAFSKHLMSTFSPSNFIHELLKNQYDSLDQTSFRVDETVNDLSMNSLVQNNQRQELLIRAKRKQLENTIFYLQKDQYEN